MRGLVFYFLFFLLIVMKPNVDLIVSRADELHASGFNCCESVLRALVEGLNLKVDGEALKVASGFGGGIGRGGCVCGGLAGAVMAVGLKHGRVNASEPREPSYSRALKMHEEFKKKFGATCCRVIRGGDFGTFEQKKKCAEIVRETTRIALKVLSE